MASRYLALIGAETGICDRIAAAAGKARLTVAIDRPGLLVLVETGATTIPIGEEGVVIGALYTIGHPGSVEALGPDAQAAIASSRGTHLVDRYWGGYVAILASAAGAGVDVVRAPFGELPCLHVRTGTGIAAASDAALLTAFQLCTLRVDWSALARHLAAGEVRGGETCLGGLRELRGGQRLTARAGSSATDTIWSPWRHAGGDRQIDDVDEAVRRVGDAARSCVKSRVSACPTPLLMLSGGLDSSVIAACLASDRHDFACLTVTTANPSGDERRHARKVADSLGVRLFERVREVMAVDLERSAAARLPRPVARAFEQDSDRSAVELANALGAGLVIDGGGGDNIFCSLQSVAPVADCLLAGNRRANFWLTAREISALAQTSLATVAWRAWLRSFQPARAPRAGRDLRFLSAGATDHAAGATVHPWLAAPEGMLPGKAAQVALLVGAQGLVEDADPQAALASLSPLVSQPLIETCLHVPSWHWFARGRNRAVARRAFERDLPAEIVWRRTKGTPDSFVVELYEANRALIAAMLLEGDLARHGLIDRAAVAAALDDPRPVRGHDFGRIMQLVDAEAWVRAWS